MSQDDKKVQQKEQTVGFEIEELKEDDLEKASGGAAMTCSGCGGACSSSECSAAE